MTTTINLRNLFFCGFMACLPLTAACTANAARTSVPDSRQPSASLGGDAYGEKYITRSISASTVKSISAASAIKVTYTPSSTGNISIVARIKEDYLDKFNASTDDGDLEFSITGNVNCKNSDDAPAIIEVTGPATLSSVEASSAGIINVTSTLRPDGNFSAEVSSSGVISLKGVKATDISIEASSAGTINVKDVLTGSLTVEASSSGIVNVTGKCSEKASIEASSMAIVNAQKLDCPNISVESSSMAKVKSGTSSKTRTVTNNGIGEAPMKRY